MQVVNDSGDVSPGVPLLISVIIVNYNGRHYLERCLPCLAAQTFPAYEVIVVDNASADGSVEWMAAQHPEVRVIPSATNLGFAEGNNLGIRAARGTWIAPLNNDTEIEPDYLERLADPMHDPTVGMVATLMLEFNRRDVIDSAGIRIDRAGFAWNRLAGERASQVTARQEVWGPCAGAALYRRAMLDQVGLFDGDYFGFYEDVDLAWRARRAGWRCLLVPEARVYHVHGGSFHHGSPQKLYLLARNRWWTVVKDYPMPGLLFNLPLILFLDLAALVRSLIKHRSLAPLRGRLAALRTLRSALAKRRG
ncbi:MAG: glycosyltransferase family 2 protein [Anaerolineae bacterium]